MNTIKDGENEYEVLTLDRISEITHAKLAGGKVVDAKDNSGSVKVFVTPSSAFHVYYIEELADNGIIPLRLVPKEPVTFEVHGKDVIFYETHTVDNHGHESPRGFHAMPIPLGVSFRDKRFRCVEIVEEA